MARRARSIQQLLDEVNARYPTRDTGSDGWVGDRAHASRPSDHNPNSRGVVQAQDFDEDTDGPSGLGRHLWNFLIASRDPRIKYVIYESRMFSSYPTSSYPAWTSRPYSGSNKHLQHLHLSVVDAPSRYDDPSPWGFANDSSEEDEMTEEQLRQLQSWHQQTHTRLKRVEELAQAAVHHAVMARREDRTLSPDEEAQIAALLEADEG